MDWGYWGHWEVDWGYWEHWGGGLGALGGELGALGALCCPHRELHMVDTVTWHKMRGELYSPPLFLGYPPQF